MPDNNHNQNTPASKPPKTKKPSGGGRFFIALIAFLALLLAAAGIGLGYYAWLELNKRFDQAAVDRQSIAHDVATIDENAKLQSFKRQMQENVAAMNQQLLDLSKQVEQQTNLQESVSQSIQAIHTHVNRSRLSWGLKEAEHVLRMANHRLRIERDVAGSITALNAADSRLHELNDQRLLPVRESISKQVGKLKNFPYPDWVGISLQLDSILAGLRQSLIADAKQQREELPQENTHDINDDEEKTGWGKLLEDVKSSINDSIKITREEQKLKLFISQQEKQRAYEFLRLRLLGAKYAVASRDDESYHRELEAALAWLENTDSLNNSNALIDELQELHEINLEPELPDISAPNVILVETMETLENS